MGGSAVLYGIGARLDSQPELLFTLRQADHFELLNSATVSSSLDKSGGVQEGLDTSELSAIFDNILLFALQLSTLADLCIGILPLMLTTENVCPILKFSYKWRLHLHHTIHECALLFFFKNQEEIEQNFPEPLQEVWDILNPSKSACG